MGTLIDYFSRIARYDWWVVAIELFLIGLVIYWAAKTGAIIVVENRVAPGEFVETGVRLDARVTAELLKTIFNPGAPLHDMAVIIRDDRIVAARVQLPLAEAAPERDKERLATPGTTDDTVLRTPPRSSGLLTEDAPQRRYGELGSRHRAAIGVTASSDATCLVVSEETGIVSITQDGKLTRNVTEPQLRRHLKRVKGIA